MGKILIVEDEEYIRSGLVQIVRNIDSNLVIYETGAAKIALEITEKESIDAFFLDIQLEDYSGLDLAKQIRDIDNYKFTPIIFITAINSREIEAFRNIHCYDYIIKPFSEHEVIKVFKEVINYGITEIKPAPVLKIKEKGFTYILNQDDIIFIESRSRRLIINTINEETDISIYTLSKLYEQLSDKFVRCHKSFIVNSSYIMKIDRLNCVLYVKNCKMPIPIGRKYKENVWRLSE